MGSASSYPGGSFGTYSPTAVPGGTGYGPYYQQPVQPVNVSIFPEQQPVGTGNGFLGEGPLSGELPIPQPNSTVSLPGGTRAGYSTEQSSFTGPALGLSGAPGSADIQYQRLTDPNFLASFYGPERRNQPRNRRGR